MIALRALILSLASLTPSTGIAQPTEVLVKAAFLVKFGAYVTWPVADGPIIICAVGRDMLGTALEQAARDQTIDGRTVVVRRMDSVERDSGCTIAYLGGSASQPVAASLATLRATPVLTVTDSRLSNVRGMIHFQLVQNRVRFDIDDQAAAQSGIEISSKLLALAVSVRARARPL